MSEASIVSNQVALIEVRNLTFDYLGFRAINNVSFSIEPGTVTALVGPNGAGKTTLLRCIAGLETPLSGRVYVNGLDVHESPRQVHQFMGYLADDFGLYRRLTVAQSLEYAACANGVRQADLPNAVATTASRMQLTEKLDHLASTLSRGQRQRLGIGQAIIHAPRVLLLDEPASGLDPQARASLAQVFKLLQIEGMSLIVSSHILAELDEYSTYMMVLHGGELLDHRAIGYSDADHQGKQRRLLRLEFIEPSETVMPWLKAQDYVELVAMGPYTVDIYLDGDAAVQAQLIAGCVAQGYQLTACMPVFENLQLSYLKSISEAQKSRYES